MSRRLLVIGAGPYGLSAAALAQQRGLDVTIVGGPMEFWRRHMPAGMLLRSGVDWHLDGGEELTLAHYLRWRGIAAKDFEPLPIQLFLDYAQWFQEQSNLRVRNVRVAALRRTDAGFAAELVGGETLRAEAVIAAPGLGYFSHVPDHPVTALPREKWAHSSDLVDFAALLGQRVLIVGGRQSAFESAALLREAGAKAVHLSYRHDTPQLTPSDWSWVDSLIARAEVIPGWFRSLSDTERENINQRFWAEGRLKLEPWLAPRIERDGVHLHSRSRVAHCRVSGDVITAILDDGTELECDFAVLATGYRCDIARVPYLAPLCAEITDSDGFPALDAQMQSRIPGLFIPGFAATRDFGPFFGFVRGCPTASRLIVTALLKTA